jgi:hypothetical protein
LNRQFYLLYPQIGQTLSDFFKTKVKKPDHTS